MFKFYVICCLESGDKTGVEMFEFASALKKKIAVAEISSVWFPA